MATDTAELDIQNQAEASNPSLPTAVKENSTPTQERKLSFISPRELKLKAIKIGKELPLEDTNPPTAESLFAPIAGNMFGEGDRPTISGKLLASVYSELVRRPDAQRPYKAHEFLAKGKETREKFINYVEEVNLKRRAERKKPFDLGHDRIAGQNGFHLDGNSTVTKDHQFYFNKSTQSWKNPNEAMTSIYVTIDQTQHMNTRQHFVDLATQMYDGGVDFLGKATGPLGTIDRTDNMVFYVSESDHEKAAKMIETFVTERKIGKGFVKGAVESETEGVAFAFEPNDKEIATWQQISGSSQPGSFNAYLATLALPRYLDRISFAHFKNKNNAQAVIYNAESARVGKILKENIAN